VRNSVRSAFQANQLDAIIAPTLPLSTLPVELLSVDPTGRTDEARAALLHHCFVANVVGIPALTMPSGFTSEELPIGLQLLGRPFDEAQLLRIGYAYQTSTGWHEHHPQVGRATHDRATDSVSERP
jgi:aspartyl-tRNA(Asn)/glutamyl-tRNA(Gln) amidotransferase subunit A